MHPEPTPLARAPSVTDDSPRQPLDGPRHAPRSAGTARIGSAAEAPEQAAEPAADTHGTGPELEVESHPEIQSSEGPAASEEPAPVVEAATAADGEASAAAEATSVDEAAPPPTEGQETDTGPAEPAAAEPAAAEPAAAEPAAAEELPVDDAAAPAEPGSMADGEAN